MQDAVDRAIDLLVEDREDASNPTLSAIIDCGEGFDDACNAVSRRVAQRLFDRGLAFEAADAVMNWVWSYMTVRAHDTGNAGMPEPAFSIYDAVDAGEYRHPGDGPAIDPVEKYTLPSLARILAEST